MNVYVFTPCKEKLITDLLIVIVTRKYHVRQAGFCYWKSVIQRFDSGSQIGYPPEEI